MAYASTLSTYVYDTRDCSLAHLLGGSVHNTAYIVGNPRREEIAIFSTVSVVVPALHYIKIDAKIV
jgi:hypothetical protein